MIFSSKIYANITATNVYPEPDEFCLSIYKRLRKNDVTETNLHFGPGFCAKNKKLIDIVITRFMRGKTRQTTRDMRAFMLKNRNILFVPYYRKNPALIEYIIGTHAEMLKFIPKELITQEYYSSILSGNICSIVGIPEHMRTPDLIEILSNRFINMYSYGILTEIHDSVAHYPELFDKLPQSMKTDRLRDIAIEYGYNE